MRLQEAAGGQGGATEAADALPVNVVPPQSSGSVRCEVDTAYLTELQAQVANRNYGRYLLHYTAAYHLSSGLHSRSQLRVARRMDETLTICHHIQLSSWLQHADAHWGLVRRQTCAARGQRRYRWRPRSRLSRGRLTCCGIRRRPIAQAPCQFPGAQRSRQPGQR